MLQNTRYKLYLVLTGMAMGIAEVIPGVSGGTIAFIAGIYERLINAIKSLDARLLGFLARFKLKAAFEHLDGFFLLFLIAGMLGGIVIGIFGVSNLMENHPEELWGFFFGLILASAWYVGKRVGKWNATTIALFIVGAVGAFMITKLSPATGSENLAYVFLCGMIAISALILPGISGSFMLLLLGMYTVIIPTLKEFLTTFDLSLLVIIGVFALGCLTGLISVARILSWLFHHKKDMTLATLTGIMLGSLNKIWPWRNPVKWLDESGAIVETDPGQVDAKILMEHNVLPSGYTVDDPNTLIVIVCIVAGFLLVLALDRFTVEPEDPDQ